MKWDLLPFVNITFYTHTKINSEKNFTHIIMAEARQLAGFKLAVKPDGKIEIDWSSGNSENI